jgi:hypothetical protein
VAKPTQRWRALVLVILVVLAGAAGLTAGIEVSRHGLNVMTILAGLVFATALVALVVALSDRLPPLLTDRELVQISDPKARLEAADARRRLRHDLVIGRLQPLAVVAVLAGAYLGFQQFAEDRDSARADRDLTRQGQASERFTRAITQLGDTKRVETRIGGIYGLAQVADQAPDNRGPVGEVLLAYLNRRHRPTTPPAAPLTEHAPDVQAALTVLCQDDTKDYTWLVPRLDLHGLGLREADLSHAYLRQANLRHTNLSRADLRSADLRRANLGRANLGSAELSGADLLMSHFRDTNLGNAKLDGADLRDADLRDADLRGADLRGADLRGADLRGVNLEGATANGRTRWPDGIDVLRAGVKVV